VQNYEQVSYDATRRLQPGPDVELNGMGSPIQPGSLEGAVRYVAEAAGVPVLVTEHGLSTEDDAQRYRFLPEALAGLDRAIADGVPVLGYCHWTFLDNFEWVSGFGPKLGLHTVDRDTLERTPKGSARVYRARDRGTHGCDRLTVSNPPLGEPGRAVPAAQPASKARRLRHGRASLTLLTARLTQRWRARKLAARHRSQPGPPTRP
jgi:hypothetical protein